ncbi:hypothetical protein ACF0H5_023564 [Mactra antiquata]
MTDDDDFDPNDDVPEWINIVIPITMVVLFVIVIWYLYKTDKEISVDTLNKWVGKLPLLNKWLLSSVVKAENERTENSNTSTERLVDTEETKLSSSKPTKPYDSIAKV